MAGNKRGKTIRRRRRRKRRRRGRRNEEDEDEDEEERKKERKKIEETTGQKYNGLLYFIGRPIERCNYSTDYYRGTF